MRSAEVFLPFAKAAAAHKKILSDDRAHFARMIQRIENAVPGKPIGHFEIITPEGLKENLSNFRTQMVAVVFNSHNNSDSSLGRVRLSADYNISKLRDSGLLTIISVEPGPASPEWLAATASYPGEWVVGAMPDADEWFEIGFQPMIMLLDGRHKVLAKDLNIDGFMAMMAHLRQQTGL